MGFFAYTSMQCQHHKEWEEVIRQVQKWSNWHDDELYKQMSGYSDPHDIEARHLEAKALCMFTMACRLVRAAYQLAGCAVGNWKLVFVETTSLLFPMLELVGHARLDVGQARAACPKRKFLNAPNLWAGLYWLQEPKVLPQVPSPPETDGTRMSAVLGLEIGHLILLRHYFLHGSQTWDDARVYIPNTINYELPRAIAKRTKEVIPDYWKQLKQDDGTQGWIKRLADADIRPLKIEGSGDFEAGLIDPDILDYLEEHRDICGNAMEAV
jgi:hypothetical protein